MTVFRSSCLGKKTGAGWSLNYSTILLQTRSLRMTWREWSCCLMWFLQYSSWFATFLAMSCTLQHSKKTFWNCTQILPVHSWVKCTSYAHSKEMDVEIMSQITASKKVEKLISIFAVHGLSKKVNRPTFTSQEFQEFMVLSMWKLHRITLIKWFNQKGSEII